MFHRRTTLILQRLGTGWVIPVLVGLILLGNSVYFWMLLSTNEQQRVEDTIDADASTIAIHISNTIDARFAALNRMADRWEFRGRPTAVQWQQDAVLNYVDFPGFRSIQWMNADYQVQWVIPSDGNEAAAMFNHTMVEQRRSALVQARQTAEMVASAPVDLAQGGRGFVVYRPVFLHAQSDELDERSPDRFDGFIIGTFVIQDIFDVAVRDAAVNGYSVAVFNADEEIYFQGSIEREHESSWGSDQVLAVAGRDLQVRVWPEADELSRQQSSLPTIALVGGFVLAVLLAVLIRLFQVARQRAADARLVSDELRRSSLALEESNRDLEQFAYVASHDLKAPLVSLRGMADILAEDYGSSLPDDGQLYIRRISANATKMQSLLDDVLQMSRLRRADAPLATVNLNSVVGSVVDQLTQMLHSRGAQVQVPEPLPVIQGNAMWLHQIFTNLIDNGVKYTPADRLPVIDIRYRAQQDHWEILVSDNGPGIPDEHQGRVFGMFQRLPEGKSANPGGSGMGLAIVARGAEAHGGKVWIESTSSTGTTFAFTIARHETDSEMVTVVDRPTGAGVTA